mmetsp:Transcript_17994/g.21572  ORF Transcript_17994/g.21572 Transcript_17994/m.21572 type:complete len:242 (+) Transcript_17994:71-796(+)|eukprot:CAMPEP_0197844780 /NCGR_PEP_ID=MMETSP1438-20131217/1762_1 /TAXON_ID=1461541 /ORGANISM="Pterosperma sp., Strain CCMP1384" /LENGTH=241 /DNA_ID=CAMNT_0043455749 /DNA_START=68 /DNA_END=793 /DNA_ORIENTATION=+
MGFFFNTDKGKSTEKPLAPAQDNAPWCGAAGIAGKGSGTTRFKVTGLPLDIATARDPSKWKSLDNATVQGDENRQYEIKYMHAKDNNCPDYPAHVSVLRDGSTLFEIANRDGNLIVYKGRGAEHSLATLDMDMGVISNAFKVFKDGSEKACLEITSRGLDKRNEYTSGGQLVARLVSDTEIEVAEGADALKVLALYIVQWWHFINNTVACYTCSLGALIPEKYHCGQDGSAEAERIETPVL